MVCIMLPTRLYCVQNRRFWWFMRVGEVALLGDWNEIQWGMLERTQLVLEPRSI